jgi:2-polyprenyl-3-methyl-5-hydroxy-6-metoxy-1,4-benzoquinol methylase
MITRVPKIKIVDFGCGDGRAAEKMVDMLVSHNVEIDKLLAVDIDPELESSNKVEVIKSDLNCPVLELPDNNFQVVYSLETIEHLINPGLFVKEAHRILVKNGIFVITTPNILAWYNRVLFLLGSLPIHYEVTETRNYGRLVANDGDTVGHVRVFSPRAAKELLEANGFRVLKIRGLRFIIDKGNVRQGRGNLIDSFFAHFPSFSSMFSIIGIKVN